MGRKKEVNKKEESKKETSKISLLEGKKAPNFTLLDYKGDTYTLNKIDSTYKIIFFYPKDSTPGCTIEAKEFSKHHNDFQKIDAQVFGISGGTLKTKEKFCTKFKLKITLLNDEDFEVSKSYGVYGTKKFMGRSYLGIYRTTLILDKNNKILKVYEDVSPLGHAKEVLGYLKEK